MSKYNLDDIPEIDPEEFSFYRAAGRTGEYFHQTISSNVLNLEHVLGWIPVGKTYDSKVLNSSGGSSDIAIMYQWADDPTEMIWFHLLEDIEDE